MKHTFKRNKLWTSLLAITMLFSIISIPANASEFSDISSTYSYLDAVNYVSDNGLMLGTDSTHFSPNSSVTRAMAVTVLYRKAGSPSVTINNNFTDVSSTAYYAKAVSWAVQKGIASGTSTTTFSPNTNVARQDAAVFMYRYLGTTSFGIKNSVSISGYSDAGSVSAYAKPAMEWAMGNGILETISGKLAPKSAMSRVALANAVTRFGTNVEKIVNSSDRLGVLNNTDYFTADRRYMLPNHVNKLASYYVLYDYGDATSVLDRINNTKYRFTGSCYGISAVTVLDKYGKIAFNETLSHENRMRDITNIRGSATESAINYYQSAYRMVGGGGRNTNVATVMNICKNAKGPVLFSYYWNEVDSISGQSVQKGHTVIVNSCTQSGSTYTLKIINPNSFSEQTITLNTSKVLTVNGKSYNLTQLEALSDFSGFNKIDIDSYKNSETAALSSTNSMDIVQPETVDAQNRTSSTLYTYLVGEFTIKNSTGEYLTWDSTGLNGNMEIINTCVVPNGEDYPASIYIDVPSSDTFTFESSSNSDIWFSISDQYRYARISGSKLGEVIIDNLGTIEFNADNLMFDAAYRSFDSTGKPETTLFTISGSGSGNIVIQTTDNGMKASGTSCKYTVTETDDYGRILNTFEYDAQPINEKIEIIDTTG